MWTLSVVCETADLCFIQHILTMNLAATAVRTSVSAPMGSGCVKGA